MSEAHIQEKYDDSIETIIDSLKKNKLWLHQLSIDDIIEYFDAVSKFWKNETKLHEKFGPSLEHATNFVSKNNLTKELSV